MINQLPVLIIVIAFTTVQFISAQGPTYDFRGSIVQPLESESVHTETYPYFTFNFLSDTTAVRTTSEASYETTHINTSRRGSDLEIGINFTIAKNLKLRTGMGVSLRHFSTTQNIGSRTLGGITSIDTVSLSIGIGGTPYCDTYTNSYFVVSESLSEGTNTKIIALKIPIELYYELFESKLKVGGGLYLQTPLWSKRRNEYVTVQRELIDGQHECKYVASVNLDKTGNNINNLQIGANVWTSYRILENLSVQIGVMKNMSNIFVGSDNQFSPLSLSVGLRYDLGNDNDEATPKSEPTLGL